MEYWLLYVVVGLIIGAIFIFIWEELDNSGAFINDQGQGNFLLQQREQILKDLKNLKPHVDSNKQDAIKSSYEFAASKNHFTLKELELKTSELQSHYKTSIKSNATYRINFPETVALNFEPKETLQLLIIINEGLHNATIHSQANYIFSIASVENGNLNVITHDNGVGYDRKNITDCNGIKSIRKATKELKADLKLTSTAGNGTVVNVEIPSNLFER